MNRLQSEWRRLYLLPASVAAGEGAEAATPRVIDAGVVRALVVELARPADWEVLSVLWRGVQADLEWPAPGIAVSGTDGLQLWFSLAAPVSAARAVSVLEGLRLRYLPDVAPARVRLWPSAAEPDRQAPLVPAAQAGSDNWSAFVAPDLAPVFADTPWLDIPPGGEGQAELLSRLRSIQPAEFDAACQRLQPPAPSVSSFVAGDGERRGGRAPEVRTGDNDAAQVDPRQFLQQVLNDVSVPLALRIEAAKALLQRD